MQKHKVTHLEAHMIRQQSNESLESYITWFTRETKRVKALPESQQVSGFIFGMKPKQLRNYQEQSQPPSKNAF